MGESVIMGRNQVLAGAISKENKFVETHPVVVLFVVVVCGDIWGPVGMIIAVPIISLVRFYVARELESNSFFSADAVATSASRAVAALLPGRSEVGQAAHVSDGHAP